MFNQVRSLQNLRSPGIVEFYKCEVVCLNENMNRVIIITEKMEGSLADLIEETKGGFE